MRTTQKEWEQVLNYLLFQRNKLDFAAKLLREAKDFTTRFRILKDLAFAIKSAERRVQSIPTYRFCRGIDGSELVFLEKRIGPIPQLIPICGRLSSLDGKCCPAPRGRNTFHSGKGLCKRCESQLAKQQAITGTIYAPESKTMMMLNRQSQIPARLRECLDAGDLLEEKVLRGVIQDTRTIYALIQYVLEGGLHTLSAEQREEANWQLNETDVKVVNMLIKTVLETKKIQLITDQTMRLDPLTVKAFVGQVMSVVFSHVSADIARRIGSDVLDRVIKPFKSSGRIVGEEIEYHEISPELTRAVSTSADVSPNDLYFPVGTAPDPAMIEAEVEKGLQKAKELRSSLAKSTGYVLPKDKKERKIKDAK